MPSEPGGQSADRQRHEALALIRRWADLDPSANPTELLRTGLDSLGFGRAERVGESSLLLRSASDDGVRPLTLVSAHDLGALTPIAPGSRSSDSDVIRGAGVGSYAGGLLAALTGLHDAPSGAAIPVDVVSIGPGDTLAGIATEALLGKPAALVFTDAVAWNPRLPTITAGSRGRVDVLITITAAAKVNDFVYAGATLNPLNRLVELLGALRGDRGRVGLPGFYERAEPPARGALSGAGTDDWLDVLGASRAGGSLSGIERATQWPVVSVLDLRVDGHPTSAPDSASAHLAFSLVPRQRPVDVERSLRAWLADNTPPSLSATIRVIRSARPYRVDGGTVPARALRRALQQVHGRAALPVPAGGTIGAGEVEYRFGAPVLFAGIIGPDARYGTTDEVLEPGAFSEGIEVMRRFGRHLAAARAAPS